MLYQPYNVDLSTNIKDKVRAAIDESKPLLLRLKKDQLSGDKPLLLTKGQIAKIEKAQEMKTGVSLKFSKKQLKANVEFKGGFLGMLAGLAARILPSLLSGLATGVVSGAVEKAITSSGSSKKDSTGDGLFLHKNGQSCRVQQADGNGLYLSSHKRLEDVTGDGLFLRYGRNIYEGDGLLLGPNSPFKNIPLLNLIL